jgi:hypothetical protein
MSEITPASVITAFWKWFGTGVLALVLITGAVVGMWQAGWIFTNANATRQAHLVQNNYNTQEGYIAAIGGDVAQIDGVIAQIPSAGSSKAADLAEALGIGNQACQEASLLTGSVPAPASMRSWIAANCSAGAVSPASPIRTGTGN